MANGNGSPLNDFRIKERDTRKRLGKVFAAFVNVPLGGYFIVGGREAPFLFGSESFKCVCIGNSALDINEGEEILRSVISTISGTFSEEDLHALVVSGFASKAMQLSLEDMILPRGIAAEFIILDMGERVIKVRFDGNVETEELSVLKGPTLIGAYDPVFRKKLMQEIGKAPNDVTSDNIKDKSKELNNIAMRAKKKLNLGHVGLLI